MQRPVLGGLRHTPFVNGAFAACDESDRQQLVNPWTGSVFADVMNTSMGLLDEAIGAARRAFDESSWPHLPPSERGEILLSVAERLKARQSEIARVEALNAGKPLSGAMREVEGAIRVFTYYAGAMDKFFGETIPLGSNLLDFTLREPLGVVAQIVPWNFPILGASWKLAPALAAGCCTLLKPSPLTPFSALLLAEICHEAGVPAGAINVVPGGAEVGRILAEDPHVDGISFTGSTAVGSEIMRLAAGSIKRVTLELGGKNANIIFASADLKRAAASATGSAFGNAGQSCSARSRILVERSAMPALLGEMKRAASSLRTGEVFDAATSLGPVISSSHRDSIAAAVETAVQAGAGIATGGGKIDGPGFFFEPTILCPASPDNPVFRNEVFGPVCSITPFDTEAEAIGLANDSDYGLNGSVWSRDISQALRVTRAFRTGMIAVNGLPSASQTSVFAPFGGYKRSGIGRELGLNALEFYTEIKNVVIDLS